jgi:hypothetical protein
MNRLIDSWLRVVHSTGSEVQVTLLVSGRRITGHLTPIQRYNEWEREVFSRAAREKGTFTLPTLELPPITPQMVQRVVADWPKMEKDLDTPGGGFALLCLRNATVHEAMPRNDWSCPLLLVATDAVAAFMPGAHS